MSEAHILEFEKIPLVDRGGGITSKPLAGAAIGATSISNGVTTFAPGTAIPLHTHNVEESVTVLEGDAIAEVSGQTQRLKPYDTTFVPPGIPHRFRNVGEGVMRILWVYAGTYVTRTFVETGETVVQLSEEDRRGRQEG